MRWVTVASEEGPRACGVVNGEYIDVNAADPEMPATVRGLLELGPEWQRRAWAALPRGSSATIRPTCKLLAPVPDPRKIVCIGLNYRDHAAESGVPVPTEPVLFSKYPTALIGHGGPIVLPTVSHEVDYEAELVVVIGRKGRHIPPRAGPRICRRLCRRPRRLRPRLAAQQAGQAVDGRQDVRHVRAGRSRAGHARRGSRPPEPRASACG